MTHIPDTLRRAVWERARGCCEYCLLASDDYVPHEIDHIYAEKHGGPTVSANSCVACFECNHHKGSDLCSLDPLSGEIVELFHPRRDTWAEHFRLEDGRIEPLTPQGRVTARLLRFNDPERVAERTALIALGRYPG